MDKKLFQEYELDAYLGDFKADFDVDGIIDDATEVGADGNRYWRDGIDLAEVCKRYEKVYFVSVGDRYARQVGESYQYDEIDGEEESTGPMDLGEARKAFREAVDGWGDGSYNVIATKTGLDTVEYKTVSLEAFTVDEDGDFQYVETVDFARSLPERVEKAMERSERGYWDFLDYEEDSYSGVEGELRP